MREINSIASGSEIKESEVPHVILSSLKGRGYYNIDSFYVQDGKKNGKIDGCRYIFGKNGDTDIVLGQLCNGQWYPTGNYSRSY